MRLTAFPLFWRVFAVNAGLLVLATVLLLVTPVTISAPIALVEALVLLAGLAIMLAANVMLLRRAFAPLDRLVSRMESVDLLRPGRRLPEGAEDEVGRVVVAFNRMLDRLEAERRESGRRALAAQEAERLRVARGLHDEVGQVLTGVLLQLDALGRTICPAPDSELAETQLAVRQALEEVRRVAQELRPELLEHLGLVSALTELARTFAQRSGIPVERRFARARPALTADAEQAVYRIAQESLTNVARHSQATKVTVSLEQTANSVVLRVIDDGRGFVGSVPPSGHGGIRGMRERALLVGGALAVKPAPGGGVEVRFEVEAAPAREPARA
jgi:two-component system sensor histidine kinase UhpB